MTDSPEKRFALACVAAGLVVVADQATKAAAIAGLSATEGLPLLGDLVTLRLAFNPGGVLSFGAQAPWLLTALGLVSIALIATAMIRARTTPWAVGLGIILGGAIGNTVDRLFSPPGFGVGHVTDFLAYGTLFIGNLADLALAVGAIILMATLWSQSRVRQADAARRSSPGSAAPTVGHAQ